MEGFWSLMCQYRELTNKKGAFKITEKELGTMQEMNPLNQKNTETMKLARRHFLGYTSAPKIFQAKDSLVFSQFHLVSIRLSCLKDRSFSFV